MPVVTSGGAGSSKTGKAISNAQTRLSGAGFSAPTDSRNWFEKLTNLPQHQNFFFDALDLFQRPFQATTGGLDSALTGSGDFGKGFMQGLTGEKKTSYSDILGDLGVENPYVKGIGGFGLDLILDPVNLIPGAAFVKGGSKIADIGAGAYKALEKKVPQLESLASIFNKDYGATIPQIARNQDFTNSVRYYTGKTGDQITEVAKKYDADPAEISRILEHDLKWTENPEELIGEMFKNRPNQRHSVNLFDGDHAKLVDDLNARIQASPVYADYVAKTQSKMDDLTTRINDAQAAGRSSAGYQKRLATLQKDMDETLGGIQYNPIGGNAEGFKVFNPKPRIFKQALGDVSQFLDDIAPKKNFDDMLGAPAGVNVRPIMDDLFRSGSATIKAGTPEADVLDRLREMFKGDATISSKPNKKGEFTINLKTGSQFHGADLDKLSFTDRLKEININRPERELTQDVGAHAAAREIKTMFEELRARGQQRGVPVSSKEGWLHHLETPEMTAKRAKVSGTGVGAYGGNDAVQRSRTYKGSIEDINARLGEQKFTDNAYAAAGVGLKKNYEYIEAQSHFNDLMKPYVHKVYKAGQTTVPQGHTVIRPEQYKFFPIDGTMGVKKGTEYVVPKAVKRYLDHAQSRIGSDDVVALFKGYDKLMNLWKGFQFFSPAFHARNDFGSSFNMFIGTEKTGGMSLANLVKYKTEALVDLKNKSAAVDLNGKKVDIVDEFARQGLKGSTFVENEFRFGGKESDKALLDRIENAQKSGAGKALDIAKNPFRSSADAGHYIDVVNKYAFYKWLRDAKKLEPEEAAKTVRQVLFDYDDLTQAEKQVMRRIVPFYTWMKKNAVFQAQQFFLQPKKYSAVDKAYDDTVDATGIDAEALPDWLKDTMAVPLSDSKLLNIAPPMADLNQVTDPLKMLANGLTPALKVPGELASNYNTFQQRPISEYPGDTTSFLGMDLPAKGAYVASQFGLLRNLDKLFNSPSEGASFGLVRNFDAETARQGKEYDMLRDLEAMIRGAKQDGTHVPTMRELGSR